MQIVKAFVKDGKCYIGEKGSDPAAPVSEDINMLTLAEGDSEGFALIGHDSACYIAQTQSDLRLVIDDLMSLCDQLTNMCDAKPIMVVTGGSGSPAVGTKGTMPAMQSAKPKIKEIKKKLEEIKLV